MSFPYQFHQKKKPNSLWCSNTMIKSLIFNNRHTACLGTKFNFISDNALDTDILPV